MAVLWTVAAGLILTYLIVFGISATARLAHSVEYMYGEAVVLAIARRAAEGLPLYPTPDQLPLTVTAYTPLYYLIVGGLQRLFGDGYGPGRAVSLLATLGAAGLLAWSVRRLGGHWAAGLLAAGLFLTQNMTALLWAPLHRVDPLALCFTLGGLALATAGHSRLAVAPLVLAVLTKQSYLVAPLAICAALWPDRRAAAIFGGLFAAGLGGAVLAAQATTGGWFLWHTALANANPYDEEYLRAGLGPFLQFNGLPLLAAAALLTLPSHPGERPWRLYFLGTLPALAAIGKMGASSNYWFELTAASSVLIGLLAARLAARPVLPTAVTEPALAMMVVGALLIPVPGYQAAVHEARSVLSSGGGAFARAQVELAPLVAAERGQVLTDEPALAVAAGRPILFEFLIFQLLAGQGLWDERPLIEAIRARSFELVILSHPLDVAPELPRWTTTFRDALRVAYAPAGEREGYWLYRPMRLGLEDGTATPPDPGIRQAQSSP